MSIWSGGASSVITNGREPIDDGPFRAATRRRTRTTSGMLLEQSIKALGSQAIAEALEIDVSALKRIHADAPPMSRSQQRAFALAVPTLSEGHPKLRAERRRCSRRSTRRKPSSGATPRGTNRDAERTSNQALIVDGGSGACCRAGASVDRRERASGRAVPYVLCTATLLARQEYLDKEQVDQDRPEHGDVVALRNALTRLPHAAYGADQKTIGPLHEKVCAVVDLLKSEGTTPERVLLAIKGIASEAHMGPNAPELIERMVQWCLEQYFKAA